MEFFRQTAALKLFSIYLLFSTLYVQAQNVGIGTLYPSATLEVKGNFRMGGLNNYISFDSTSGKIQWTNAKLFVPTPQYLIQHSASAEGLYYGNSQLEYRNQMGNPVFFTNWNNGYGYFSGNLGIGINTPGAKLSISSYGTELAGSAASNLIRTNAGVLGNQVGDEISLANIGFASNNNSSLGIRAWRNIAGSDWMSTALLLEYDVDNTARVNSSYLALSANGNIGIGTKTPVAKLEVAGQVKITGGAPGTGKVLTSDANGLASWQPPPTPPSMNYPVVWICCNPWMTKNLDVSTYRNGDPIPKVTDNAAWAVLTTGAYCYYNNDSTTYAATYGKLYNWYAVNDPRGLAPEGWHIPSQFEWTTLGTCLGGNLVAGGPMKEIGTTHWISPNTEATNFSSFTGFPGGSRNDSSGTFSDIGSYGNWWSSTVGDTNHAWDRSLSFNNAILYSLVPDMRFGFSVRCLRD